MGKVIFISGMDTDAGKTYVTSRLAKQAMDQGVNVITQKPVQTGCTTVAEDLEEHRRVMGTGLLPIDANGPTCTYLFRKPASPALAARLEGQRIDTTKIDQDTATLANQYELVLQEGAGGLMVPLNESELTIDYVAERHMPLILVVSSRLGSINHALLSIEACKHHGIDLRLVIFNRLPQDDTVMADDALMEIRHRAQNIYPGLRTIDFGNSEERNHIDLMAL